MRWRREPVAGTLDDDGRAVLPVYGPDGAVLTKSQVWSHD